MALSSAELFVSQTVLDQWWVCKDAGQRPVGLKAKARYNQG